MLPNGYYLKTNLQRETGKLYFQDGDLFESFDLNYVTVR